MPSRPPRRKAAKRSVSGADLIPPRPTLKALRGATAAQALLGSNFRLTQHRGEFVASALAPLVLATVHPSSLLRAPDPETRHRETDRFVADLRQVARAMSKPQHRPEKAP
jgi:uracil-DNA glycosylase